MNLYLAFVPLVAILLFLTLRNPSKAKVQEERPDFFIKAAESMSDVKDSVLFDSGAQGFDDGEYTYEVVGESYQRDHLTALIRAHNAFETGRYFRKRCWRWSRVIHLIRVR